MTHGFVAYNNNNQVLVSSDTKNLHFVGKASFYNTIKSTNGYGGIRHWSFRIACNVTPMPFFSMPTEDYYGIAAVRQVSAGLWEIEIIRSGTSDIKPEVYVFADPAGVTTRSTNYGAVVYNDSGEVAFDSRLRPLCVTGGVFVNPPSNPLLGSPGNLSSQYCQSNPQASMGSDNRNTFSISEGSSKPIYFYPSIAQAEREFGYSYTSRECTGFDLYGFCLGYQDKYTWNSYYWAFYRSGIKRVGGYMFCGWIAVQYGCHWDYKDKGSFIGIGVGTDSSAGGSWPYSNQTINLQLTAVITAEGLRYD